MRIVLIGASGHAKVVADAVERCGEHEIIGLIDTYKSLGSEVGGYPVLGTEDSVAELCEQHRIEGGVVTIGDNWTRAQMVSRVRQSVPWFTFISVAHPDTSIGRGVSICPGSVLLAGAVVNADSRIGYFCILNTKSSLDHDSVMEDFSSLMPNSATGGNVRIGAYSSIGMGAAIIHGLSVGEHTVIGAGATVVRDMPSHCVAMGTPARVVRRRSEDEKYL